MAAPDRIKITHQDPMTIPTPRAALTQLLARLDQTTDKAGPVPAWMDSYCTAVQALKAEPETPAEAPAVRTALERLIEPEDAASTNGAVPDTTVWDEAVAGVSGEAGASRRGGRAVNEHDPTGRGQHEPGAKLDAMKPRPALVLGSFSRALTAVAHVGTYGAIKYTPNGWRTVPDGVERYSEAMMRHWLDECQGIECDAESNMLHAAHLAWNALARLELMLLKTERKG